MMYNTHPFLQFVSVSSHSYRWAFGRCFQATQHWMAILKPAHWQVSVDAKEAQVEETHSSQTSYPKQTVEQYDIWKK